jgi:hypothetical protein
MTYRVTKGNDIFVVLQFSGSNYLLANLKTKIMTYVTYKEFVDEYIYLGEI